MTLIPFALTFSLMKRFSDGSQNFLNWMFGLKTRFVLLCACDTLFPATGLFPVT
jgi:hypothetical protein